MNTSVDDDVALDLFALGRALWRSKVRILLLVAGTLALTFLALQFVPSQYRGQAKILIESRAALYPAAERAVEAERALLDQEGVASQVQLLRSYDLARRVAARLKLSELKEFNKSANGGSILSRLPVMLGFASDPARSSQEEKVLDIYFKKLNVYPVEKTRVIAVEFSSTDRELAAKAANTIVEEYLAQQASAKRQTTEDAAGQLEPEIARVRSDVEAAERKVEEFRAGADLLLGANNVTLVQQQLAELNTQLAAARAARSEAQAKASQLRDALTNGGSLESASEVLNSQLIQRLRESQVALQARIAELSTSLLPSHPQFRALRRQLSDLEAQIRGEARKIQTSLESDAKVTQVRVESLLASLNELKAAVSKSNEKRIALRDLERDAKIKGTQLEAMLARYREQNVRGTAANLPDARLISRASVPLKPYTPKTAAITIIAGLAVFILAVCFVLLREFVTGSALQRSAPARAVRADSAADDVAAAKQAAPDAPEVPMIPVATYTTSAAGLWQQLLASGDPAKCIAVLTLEDDSVAQDASLGLLRAAVHGEICPILVETQSEEPVSGADAHGLSELLRGEASFSQVIQRDPASRAHVIEAGETGLSADLVGLPAFDTIMEALNHTYDHVVIDLGRLDRSEVADRFLAHADHVVIATGGSSDGPMVEKARRLMDARKVQRVSVLASGQAGARAVLRDMAA